MVFFLTGQWNANVVKRTVIVIICTLFLGEYLVFLIATFLWNVPVQNSNDSLKVLVLSDPQIQGLQFEHPGIIGSISRWDACRYLKKTFSYAMWFVKPDVVIFLGDLFDEGYISSDEQFTLYKKWFDEIYQIPSSVKRIHLAGDNDVGGEAEPLRFDYLGRHEKHFGPTNEIIRLKNWQFLKLNTISFLRTYYQTLDEKQIAKNLKTFLLTSAKTLSTDKHTVVLSHLPVQFWDTNFAVKVLVNINPRAIFSGHLHKSYYRRYSSDGYTVDEHVVPTCSYRMGTTKMGMGVVAFEADGSFQYSVLQLPGRYFYLFSYVAVLSFSLIYVLIFGRTRGQKVSFN